MDFDITMILQLWDQLGWVGKTLAVLLAIHPVASVIVAVTPTPKDNSVVAMLYTKIIQPLALNVGKSFDKGGR